MLVSAPRSVPTRASANVKYALSGLLAHDRTNATTTVEHDRTNVATGEVGEVRVAPLVAVPTPDMTTAVEGEAPRTEVATEARRPVSYAVVFPDVWALARGIAAVLGETLPPPIRLITRIVDRLGPARARALLGQALTVEAQGGFVLPDGTRRTPGGVFFHLVRADATLSPDERAYIFPRQGGGLPQARGGASTPPPAPPPTAWTDDTYRALAQQLQQDNEGRATTVKIIVIGRPGTAVEQGQAVVVALTSEKVPDLPKGLPAPPAGTRYTVFVARKPWAKVVEALAADPEDAAIIEGYAALDPRVEGIAVYATSATTKRT